MCGIAGVLHADAAQEVTEGRAERMLSLLRHRGPDDRGRLLERGVALLHTRLAVLDLSPRARQPMESASGRLVIAYNGEVYNYRELRADLEREGCSFRSQGDTEVVLELVERHGVRAISRLMGMFAFAIFDREQRELTLVRDRVGIKPLFYATEPAGVSFASEPKALLPFLRRTSPSPARVAEYLAFRHLAGDECLSPEVHTLAPGHLLSTDGVQVRTERWWQPKRQPERDPDSVAGIVRSAVQRQLVSDVPVGIFLSGGVDSALVAEAAASESEIHSFTVGFEEEGWDESDRSALVARTLGSRAHVTRIDPADYARGLGPAVWHLDAPLNHAHSVHLLRLSEYARRHITVALTGEGGDELYAGYPRYRLHLASRWLSGLPGPMLSRIAERLRVSRPRWARLLDAAAAGPRGSAALNAAFLPVDEAVRLAGADDQEAVLVPRLELVEQAVRAGWRGAEVLLEVERQTYLVSLLQRMDRMSMAHGLECRVPLLDEEVMAHAHSLPVHERVTLFDSKRPLRRAAAARFGRRYANAPKSGFGVPLDAWFASDGPIGRFLVSLLGDRRTRERGWLDVDRAQHLLRAHRRGQRDWSEALWGAMNLELWARIGMDGEAPCELARMVDRQPNLRDEARA